VNENKVKVVLQKILILSFQIGFLFVSRQSIVVDGQLLETFILSVRLVVFIIIQVASINVCFHFGAFCPRKRITQNYIYKQTTTKNIKIYNWLFQIEVCLIHQLALFLVVERPRLKTKN
jgi:hypothetical protein